MKPSLDKAIIIPRIRVLLLNHIAYCRRPSLTGCNILRSTSFLI
jgi:hypothetical protein